MFILIFLLILLCFLLFIYRPSFDKVTLYNDFYRPESWIIMWVYKSALSQERRWIPLIKLSND